MSKYLNKKDICLVAGIVAFFIVSFVLKAPQSLEAAAAAVGSSGSAAMKILGITALAIFWWVGDKYPDWLTTIAMMLLWIIVAKVSFNSAFAAFAGTSAWLIAGAFCLAAAIGKTGFFTRISWALLQIFPPTFRGQVIALMVVGAICTPLIPSSTAKAVLGVTIASGVATAMGYENNSPGRYGLFAAAWIGFGALVPAFVSGSVFGYTLLGALPEDAGITWGSWCIAMLPWLFIMLAGCFVAIMLLYNPKGKGSISKEYAKEQYKKLGKLQGKELQSAIILACSVVLWIFESQLGIPAAVTAMLAAFFCFVLGILDRKEIATAPNWNLIIFLGGVLSLGSIFSKVGIDMWLQALLSPVFEKMNNPYLMVVIIAATVVLIRFVLVSQSATIIIMLAILSPVASTIGLSPFTIGLIVYTAETCWFVPYQNAVFATAFACNNGTLEHKGTIKLCVAFQIISVIACLVSLPYWNFMGYI